MTRTKCLLFLLDLAHTILLAVGYLKRQNPASLHHDPVPSLIMHSTSNRLASSVPHNRLLGMLVGTGMSRSIDELSKALKFDIEEMNSAESKEMLGLLEVQDSIGTLDQLKKQNETLSESKAVPKKQKTSTSKLKQQAKAGQSSRILSIEEVSTSSDDEDDLVPYQKPREDPEDSDEDPTLINRDKPRAPLYIPDLIKQMQSPSDKQEIISLGLESAPKLIRRKAGFGTELSDNIHSLAAALINLQDGMSKPEHQKYKLDVLIACVVAEPKAMGKYLTNMYFQGDYSLAQRSTILSALGLGAREVAGFKDVMNTYTGTDEDLFPSNRLPAHLQPNESENGDKKKTQKRLTGTSNPLSMLTDLATRATIQPMAVAAAKTQSGPEILQFANNTRVSSKLMHSRNTSNSVATIFSQRISTFHFRHPYPQF